MRIMSALTGLAFACLTLYIVATVLNEWRKYPELSGWNRWRETARGSGTILWTKFSLAVAGVVANLDTIFNAMGLPQVTEAINKYVDPKVAAGIIAVIALGAGMSRMRTL